MTPLANKAADGSFLRGLPEKEAEDGFESLV